MDAVDIVILGLMATYVLVDSWGSIKLALLKVQEWNIRRWRENQSRARNAARVFYPTPDAILPTYPPHEAIVPEDLVPMVNYEELKRESLRIFNVVLKPYLDQGHELHGLAEGGNLTLVVARRTDSRGWQYLRVRVPKFINLRDLDRLAHRVKGICDNVRWSRDLYTERP